MPSPTDAGGTPSGDAVDRFEAAYTEGVHYEPAPAVARPQDTRRELLVREAPAEAVALAGCVLTPDRAIEKGYVVVGAGKQIQAVTEQRPQGVHVHETGGVITPGLIDLHGHPEFNIFAAWEPPQQFINRYAWRGSGLYKQLVREPQNKLLTALPAQTQLRYAEIRALVGGVTAIQGTGGAATAYQDESLVRNVDKWIFGSQVARAMIDLPTATSRDMERLNKILDEIAHDQIKAFYLHLCEGRTDNQRSQDEFKRFIELKALTPSTVVIHGTSLTREQLGQLKDGGAKLVWSPQSNLRLYGETTRAGDALELGMLVGLGADWLPSGSTSLLSEIKVARRSLVEQGHTPTSKRLLAMVTTDAAKIAGLDDKLGKLASGRPADLCVFERRIENPWDNVVEADPSWVELVMIDGDLTYGRADWLGQLADSADGDRFEPLIAWGKPMLLDASYTAAGAGGGEQTKLAQLRAALIKEYPQVGPILA